MREVREAARHGEQRRKLGLDERFILFEYYLLQQVLTRFVQIHAAPKAARHAIVHLEESLRFATYASIRGYHRGTFQKRGEWPATVERLADEWAA
jgi:hypothetical protein